MTTVIIVNDPDLPADPSTTASLVLNGGPRAGVLGFAGDRDWYRVELQAGKGYEFFVRGASSNSGSLPDPLFRLFDGAGRFLASDDDAAVGLDARFVFVPSASGTYYVEVSASGDGAVGTYQVSFRPPFLSSVPSAADTSKHVVEPKPTGIAMLPVSAAPTSGPDSAETLFGTGDEDLLEGFGGGDRIEGGLGNDTIYGDYGPLTDRTGVQGDDLILAGDGDDQVFGGGGMDAIDGGAGNDILYGEAGSNYVVGGAGSDIFVVDFRQPGFTWSTIADATRLAGSQLDAVHLFGWRPGGSGATFSEQVVNGTPGTTISFDIDGDGAEDARLTLNGLARTATESQFADATQKIGVANADLLFSLFA